jgi:hypothetical protein
LRRIDLGSRAVIGTGIYPHRRNHVRFAMGESTGSLIFWRILSGIAAAAV